METIYVNKEEIKKSDIPFQLIRGILFLILLYVVSKIKFINEELSSGTTIFLGVLISLIFMYSILVDKTIKRIENNSISGKLIFTFARQLRGDFKKELIALDTKVEIKNFQVRETSKRVLLISDKENKIKLSTSQKGISKSELDTIKSKIENLSNFKA